MTDYRVFLSLIGLHLLQSVCSTTPACGPGQLQCTTAGNLPVTASSFETPRVERVQTEKCGTELDTFCFHGECMFLLELNIHTCRCDTGFTGERCAHSELVFQPMSKGYILLTVTCTVLFLTALAIAFYFFYKWSKKNKCTSTEKKYQEIQLA
ncbi:proepiregulin-like isoform X1 [Polyodon spathula]|uniref:proepiregulin-like isoform X1 n=1 Tax=Polyodon spathula TaxID=7913 RepID=UPI001B7E1656|nr:proepiregulin-like isoform X1 [Polyodon spathula]